MDRIEQNKQMLERANAAIAAGNYEGFLSYCTEDTIWTFVGEQILKGKGAVGRYMAETYLEPPRFAVELLTGEGDVVTAVGKISLKDKDGEMASYSYCDVWTLRDGKPHDLKAFVIQNRGIAGTEDQAVTVIGSGFSYDENEHPTDETEPASQVDDEEIVELPDLGKPNRP